MSGWSEGSVHFHRVSVRKVKPELFYVYIAYGRGKRPQYVGKSNQPLSRIGTHLALAPWAKRVLVFHCYGFATEQEALAAELRAIKELNPIHNVLRWEPPIDEAEQAAIIRRVQNREAA